MITLMLFIGILVILSVISRAVILTSNPHNILLGAHFMDYEASDGSEGIMLSIGLLFIALDFYF